MYCTSGYHVEFLESMKCCLICLASGVIATDKQHLSGVWLASAAKSGARSLSIQWRFFKLNEDSSHLYFGSKALWQALSPSLLIDPCCLSSLHWWSELATLHCSLLIYTLSQSTTPLEGVVNSSVVEVQLSEKLKLVHPSFDHHLQCLSVSQHREYHYNTQSHSRIHTDILPLRVTDLYCSLWRGVSTLWCFLRLCLW